MMKKKLLIAVILLIGFISVLSFLNLSKTKETKTEVHPKTPHGLNSTYFKGENDFWKAEFTTSKNGDNQLTIRHTRDDIKLPSTLKFTLTTPYKKGERSLEIGKYDLTFEQFPKKFSLLFEENNSTPADQKQILLKITGQGHYQLFLLYKEE